MYKYMYPTSVDIYCIEMAPPQPQMASIGLGGVEVPFAMYL